jgi:hypothetical protein
MKVQLRDDSQLKVRCEREDKQLTYAAKGGQHNRGQKPCNQGPGLEIVGTSGELGAKPLEDSGETELEAGQTLHGVRDEGSAMDSPGRTGCRREGQRTTFWAAGSLLGRA